MADRFVSFEHQRSYKTYDNALKKLNQVLEGIQNPPTNFIAVTRDGRFVPVAAGERALQLGLHFHIAVVG